MTKANARNVHAVQFRLDQLRYVPARPRPVCGDGPDQARPRRQRRSAARVEVFLGGGRWHSFMSIVTASVGSKARGFLLRPATAVGHLDVLTQDARATASPESCGAMALYGRVHPGRNR